MNRLALISLGLLTWAPLAAQDTRQVVVRSLCFQQVDGIKEVYYGPDGPQGDLVKIPLWLREPSEDIELKVAGNILSFYGKSAAADEQGPPLLARGALGAGRRHLLFFVPTPQEDRPYRMLSFPDDATSFPMGATRLLNLSKVSALFQLGEHQVKVDPGKSAVAPMPRSVNSYNDYNFEIKLETPRGLYPVRQTRGKAVRTKRDMAVVYLDPRTKRARVNLYTDIPPWSLPELDTGED